MSVGGVQFMVCGCGGVWNTLKQIIIYTRNNRRVFISANYDCKHFFFLNKRGEGEQKKFTISFFLFNFYDPC